MNMKTKFLSKLVIITLCFLLTTSPSYAFMVSEANQNDKPSDEPNADTITIPLNSLTYQYSFSDLSFEETLLNGARFCRVALPDCILIGESGNPLLPVKTVRVIIPQTMKVAGINVVGEPVEVDMIAKGINLQETPVIPEQPEVPFSSVEPPEFVMNQQIYSSSASYPGKLYNDDGLGSCCGYQILTVHMFPVQYVPGSAKIMFYRQLDLTVQLSPTQEKNVLYRGLPADIAQVKALVTNPEIIDTYTSIPRDTMEETQTLCAPQNDFDFVLITNEALNNTIGYPYNWQDLLQHRSTYSGLSSMKITVETIDACPAYWNTNPLFNDSAAHIRAFIIDAYQNWGTKYVLLGGDWDLNDPAKQIVPARIFTVSQSYDEYNTMPSDMYYSNLDGDWWDPVHGVWGGGQNSPGNDPYTEVFVGRITADSAEQVSNSVGKILWYDQCTDTDYLRKAVFFGGNLGWTATSADYMEEIRNGTDPNFYQCKGFSEWNAEHPDPILQFDISERRYYDWGDLIPVDYQMLINHDDACIINHLSHANPEFALDMFIPDLQCLTNSKFFFAYSEQCLSGRFTWGDSTEKTLLCDSPQNGAFAVIFNTGYGWGFSSSTNGAGQFLQRNFWDYLFGVTGDVSEWVISAAHFYSKDMISAYMNQWHYAWVYTFYSTHLFGDPAQAIRITMPEHNVGISSVEAPQHVNLGIEIPVNATVVNNGEYDETNVNIRFFVNDVEVENQTIPFLGRYTTCPVYFQWTPPTVGLYMLTINVTLSGIPEKTYEDNEQEHQLVIGVQNVQTNECFPTIQDALDDPETIDGHTIMVPSGIFAEQLTIHKDISLIGVDPESTILQGMGSNPVVFIQNTAQATISGFSILDGTEGIFLTSSSNTSINHVTINNCTDAGVRVDSSYNTHIFSCTISNCTNGISLSNSSSASVIYENIIVANQLGLSISETCVATQVYKNNFNNTQNALDFSNVTLWDNGYPKGGNWWSDYTGVDQKSGSGQDQSDPDGIGDTRYNIPGGTCQDRYPLKYPFDALVVNLNSGFVFSTIQSALIHPQTLSGNVILIKSHVYHEHLLITKSSLILRGEDRNTTIIDGDGSGTVVNITASCVKITGLTIRNGGKAGNGNGAGIKIRRYISSTTIIGNNIVDNKRYGIYLETGSMSNQILQNTISNNTLDGIYLDHCGATISGNTIANSYNGYGIYMKQSGGGTINGNLFMHNREDGIYLNGATYVTISGNSFESDGISIEGTTQAEWKTHTIYNNAIQGRPLYYLVQYYDHQYYDYIVPSDAAQVILVNCDNVIIQDISFTCNVSRSIQLAYCSNIDVLRNTIVGDYSDVAIQVYSSSYNIISDNTVVNMNTSQIYRTHYSTIMKLTSADYNMISSNIISNSYYGIWLHPASFNTISNNDVTNIYYGIILLGTPIGGRSTTTSCNIISENTVRNCRHGVDLASAFGTPDNNVVYRNNFFTNEKNGVNTGNNFWYNSTLGQGNYWDDYTGADELLPFGIGDTPYFIGCCETYDMYPLTHPYIPGDMNVDSMVNFGDINPFVSAFVNPDVYQEEFKIFPALHGDINQDGALDFGDIQPFIRLLQGFPNAPPDAPAVPQGPRCVIFPTECTYSTTSEDSMGDHIKYYFDFGDGMISDWTNFFESGATISQYRYWDCPGTFSITVKAKDVHGSTSTWSEPLQVRVVYLGDMNGDDLIDFGDINPFVLALSNPAAYQNSYPDLDPNVVGDINQDGVLDFGDINPFVQLLTGGG